MPFKTCGTQDYIEAICNNFKANLVGYHDYSVF